jgi:uncharacterized protein with HEPN domain
MSQRDLRAYLWDIKQACEHVAAFTAGKTFADYSADVLLRSAVERQFEIIGEALNLAVRHDPNLEQRITDTRRIIAFRNRLIHGYATVADSVVWGIVEGSLPTLRAEIDRLLEGA